MRDRPDEQVEGRETRNEDRAPERQGGLVLAQTDRVLGWTLAYEGTEWVLRDGAGGEPVTVDLAVFGPLKDGELDSADSGGAQAWARGWLRQERSVLVDRWDQVPTGGSRWVVRVGLFDRIRVRALSAEELAGLGADDQVYVPDPDRIVAPPCEAESLVAASVHRRPRDTGGLVRFRTSADAFTFPLGVGHVYVVDVQGEERCLSPVRGIRPPL